MIDTGTLKTNLWIDRVPCDTIDSPGVTPKHGNWVVLFDIENVNFVVFRPGRNEWLIDASKAAVYYVKALKTNFFKNYYPNFYYIILLYNREVEVGGHTYMSYSSVAELLIVVFNPKGSLQKTCIFYDNFLKDG